MAQLIIDQFGRDRQARRLRIFRDRTHPLEVYDDEEVLQRFRFRREDIWNIVDLISHDVDFRQRRRGSLSATMQLLVALRFFGSGGFQMLVGDTVRVHRSTVSRVIHRVARALARLQNQWIYFPDQRVCDEQKAIFFETAGFPRVIGCVDCTHVQMIAPEENEHEFVNRKGKHSINTQLICDANLRIMNCVVKHPGAVHDARIIRESSVWRAFEALPKPLQGLLLGDSGYPCRDWLLTPVLNEANEGELRYNVAHRSTRSAIERCNGVLKRRFACLDSNLRYQPEATCTVILACCVLHNMSIEFRTPMREDWDFHQPPPPPAHAGPEQDITVQGRIMRQSIIDQFFG